MYLPKKKLELHNDRRIDKAIKKNFLKHYNLDKQKMFFHAELWILGEKTAK